MVDYVSMAAMAKRLIDENGREVTIIQQGHDPQDSTQPWRGLSTYSRYRVTGNAVFTKLEGDGSKRKVQMMLFAANDDLGQMLEEFDQVEDGDLVWKIDGAEVVGPADSRVIYKFEVSR